MRAFSLALLLTGSMFYSTAAFAAQTSLPIDNLDACHVGPLEQFGRYLGDWTIKDETLSQDGSGWAAGAGALWNFVCVGKGIAIQDFWIPNGGEVGTNLRTYNTDTGSWDIAWATKPQSGYARISAKLQADNTIVMHYIDPIPGPQRRITFFPPDDTGWRWRLEFSNDEGTSWRAVYRMKATRSTDDTATR